MKALERMELMINETLDLKGVPKTFHEYVTGAALASVSLTEMRALLAVAKAVGARNKARCWSACDDQDPAECVCGSEAIEGCPCLAANHAIGAAYKALEELP